MLNEFYEEMLFVIVDTHFNNLITVQDWRIFLFLIVPQVTHFFKATLLLKYHSASVCLRMFFKIWYERNKKLYNVTCMPRAAFKGINKVIKKEKIFYLEVL